MKFKILYLLYNIISINCFNIINNNIGYINKNSNKVIMYYEETHDFEKHITALSGSQTHIIIDNWIKATQNINVNNNIDNSIDNSINNNIYEFKVFISINKNSINTIYFSWIPETHMKYNKIIYLIAAKLLNNELHIYRIAQNPYANNLLNINSTDLLLDLYNYYINNEGIKQIRYDELHNYDKRYILSWNFIKN